MLAAAEAYQRRIFGPYTPTVSLRQLAPHAQTTNRVKILGTLAYEAAAPRINPFQTFRPQTPACPSKTTSRFRVLWWTIMLRCIYITSADADNLDPCYQAHSPHGSRLDTMKRYHSSVRLHSNRLYLEPAKPSQNRRASPEKGAGPNPRSRFNTSQP